MRYSRQQKKETRRRIVQAASRAFRLQGVDGASVSDIMAEAGLTVGGFYRHFQSKEELFQEALEQAMDETISFMQRRQEEHQATSDQVPPSQGQEWMSRAAAAYLNLEHRRMRGAGCPLPELTAEVIRRQEGARQSFEQSLGQLADAVAERIDPEGGPGARQEAWGMLSTLVGSLMLARGVAGEDQAQDILEAGRVFVSKAAKTD